MTSPADMPSRKPTPSLSGPEVRNRIEAAIASLADAVTAGDTALAGDLAALITANAALKRSVTEHARLRFGQASVGTAVLPLEGEER